MALRIEYTNKMKRDVKLMKKRGKDLNKLINVLELLTGGELMPKRFRDHPLTGGLNGFRACHIEPDWLLIYKIYEDALVLSASATGSHSDLFDE